MRFLLSVPLCLLPLVAGCAQSTDTADPKTALAPGLELEIAFDGTCAPVASAQLSCQAIPKEITYGAGVEGQAARFDGLGAAVHLSGLANLGIRNSMTLECFVNADDWTIPGRKVASLQSVISHSTIFGLALDTHSRCVAANLTPSGRDKPIRLEGGRLEPKTWYHVALSYDGQFARLYLNGLEVALEAAPGELVLNDALDLTLGTWFKANQAFQGQLDSVRLWSRALTPEELAARASRLSATGAPPIARR